MSHRYTEKQDIEAFTINRLLDGLDVDAVCEELDRKFGDSKKANVNWYQSKVKAVLNTVSPNRQTTRRMYEVYRDNRNLETDEIIEIIRRKGISRGSVGYLTRNVNVFKSIESCLIARGERLNS